MGSACRNCRLILRRTEPIASPTRPDGAARIDRLGLHVVASTHPEPEALGSDHGRMRRGIRMRNPLPRPPADGTHCLADRDGATAAEPRVSAAAAEARVLVGGLGLEHGPAPLAGPAVGVGRDAAPHHHRAPAVRAVGRGARRPASAARTAAIRRACRPTRANGTGWVGGPRSTGAAPAPLAARSRRPGRRRRAARCRCRCARRPARAPGAAGSGTSTSASESGGSGLRAEGSSSSRCISLMPERSWLRWSSMRRVRASRSDLSLSRFASRVSTSA